MYLLYRLSFMEKETVPMNTCKETDENYEIFFKKNNNGILVSLSLMTIMLSFCLSSPLLTEIASDLGTDLAFIGYLPTIITMFMGISVLTSAGIVTRFGIRKVMTVAMGLVAIGDLLPSLFDSVFILFLSRAFVGTGMGTLGAGFSSIAAGCYTPKNRSVFVTLFTLGNSLAGYVCFLIAIPLFHLLEDSWRSCYLLFGILSAAITVGWWFLGTDINFEATDTVAKESGVLRRVLMNRDVWFLTLYHSLAYLSTNVMENYLPAYLQVVRGFTASQAASWTGMIALLGMLGTIAGGWAMTKISARKPLLLAGGILTCITMTGIIAVPNHVVIFICIALFGFVIRYRVPPTTMVSTEIKDNDPAFASAAYAVMYAVGSVIGIFSPAALSAISNRIGMEKAMLCFAGLVLIATLFTFPLRETGRK